MSKNLNQAICLLFLCNNDTINMNLKPTYQNLVK